jgi:hypothetical protein
VGLNRAERERVRARIRRQLGEGNPALPFTAAVAVQLAGRESNRGLLDDAWLEAVVEPVLAVLRAAEADESERAEQRLVADLPLLSAVFQNIDLLYEHAAPVADAVSRATLQALHEASAADDGPT